MEVYLFSINVIINLIFILISLYNMSLQIYMWKINHPALSHIMYKLLNIPISARSLDSHVMRSGRLIGRSSRNLRLEFIIVLIFKGTVHVKKMNSVIVYKPGQTPFIILCS